MKLPFIQSVEQAQSVYKTGKPAYVSGLKPLSNDEQELIKQQFPVGANRRLELYMSNGNQRSEMPEAKGRNFDFRV
jgi:hypothetical protein